MTISSEKHDKERGNSTQSREFDGVICFGGCDWWYHNRGHYDLQMMREFSQSMPVLYVNSLGIRVPAIREGKMFFTRVTRKLRSLARGFKKVHDNFGVLSPVVIPGKAGMAISRSMLAPQVRRAARKMGITRPLVWIECTPACQSLESLSPAAVIYQRTDRWEAFPDCDRQAMTGFHRHLQQRADITLFCATLLFEEEGPGCRHALYVDHGVDFDRFATAGTGTKPDPDDVAQIPHPRVGFVGGIDGHTFDPAMFVEVARQLNECQFVMIGSCSLPEGWCSLPNVNFLGRRGYETVADYMASCDVLIMPWNDSEWIRACNPVKLKEYLAVGRPIVTTDFHELVRYEGYVRRARNATEFAQQIRLALADPFDPEGLRARVREETWPPKCQKVLRQLEHLGFSYRKIAA